MATQNGAAGDPEQRRNEKKGQEACKLDRDDRSTAAGIVGRLSCKSQAAKALG
jgi:hypothetical protein